MSRVFIKLVETGRIKVDIKWEFIISIFASVTHYFLQLQRLEDHFLQTI